MSKKIDKKEYNIICVKGEENRSRLEDYKICKDYAIKLYKRDEMPENYRIPMVSDSMFKLMLLNESRKKYACKLLSSLLNVSYEDFLENLELYKNVFDKNNINSKSEIGDFVAKMNDTFISIEMNINNNVYRNVEYTDRLYASKVKVGDKVYRYKGVIQLNFNNYSYEGHDKTINIYRVQDDEKEMYVNKTYIEIYLPKIREKMYNKGIEKLSETERCILAMFESDMSLASELSKGDDILEEFMEEASLLISDYDLKESYDHTLDYAEGMRKEGKEEGKEEGEQQEKIETAKRMLASDFNIDQIQKATNLPIEEIQKLKND